MEATINLMYTGENIFSISKLKVFQLTKSSKNAKCTHSARDVKALTDQVSPVINVADSFFYHF